MNVLDHLKTQTVEQIKDYCSTTCIDASVAMLHVNGDFNLSTLVRNANFFGFAQVMCILVAVKIGIEGEVWVLTITPI